MRGRFRCRILNSSALWSLESTVMVPAFMILGFSPSITQATPRFGDSLTQDSSSMHIFLQPAILLRRCPPVPCTASRAGRPARPGSPGPAVRPWRPGAAVAARAASDRSAASPDLLDGYRSSVRTMKTSSFMRSRVRDVTGPAASLVLLQGRRSVGLSWGLTAVTTTSCRAAVISIRVRRPA
jgi:hypothetical protein